MTRFVQNAQIMPVPEQGGKNSFWIHCCSETFYKALSIKEIWPVACYRTFPPVRPTRVSSRSPLSGCQASPPRVAGKPGMMFREHERTVGLRVHKDEIPVVTEVCWAPLCGLMPNHRIGCVLRIVIGTAAPIFTSEPVPHRVATAGEVKTE
jgi:hypothetical protein